jgi:hypothetical protein
MTHEHGATDDKKTQADFVGILALVLMAVSAASALLVALAAMTAG